MYYLPRVLHFDSAVPNQPQFDTLIGLCNPFTIAQEFRIHCFDTNGMEAPKSPLIYTLAPGRSVATTFIKENIFPDPPQNWQGYATLEFPAASPFGSPENLPAMCCLGGDGPTPKNWNYATPSVQVLGVNQTWSSGTRWVFPYCIPYFRDPVQHTDEHEYRSGLSISNLDSTAATLQLTYTVGDFYPNEAQRVTSSLTVAPSATVVKQLHELFPAVLTMNPREDGSFEGSEGWLDITSPVQLNLMMWLVCANRDYNLLGFSQQPWIL